MEKSAAAVNITVVMEEEAQKFLREHRDEILRRIEVRLKELGLNVKRDKPAAQ